MSLSGKFTPLQLNALSGLMRSEGFRINPTAQAYQGTWTPSTYTAGSVTTNTVLYNLTRALPLIYSLANNATYRNAIAIGSGVCAALGNSRPTTFQQTYAGASDPYPPLGYPGNYSAEPTWSYITGWTDTVYNTAQRNTSSGDSYFSQGFIALFARQAYYEFWNLSSGNHYLRLIRSIGQYKNWRDQTNQIIASFKNTKGFLDNAYSNMNDLTTADISGLSLAFKYFGNDLIALGNTINLADIEFFGQTDKFLLQLQAANALTDSLKLALLAQGLTTDELNSILISKTPATDQQRKKIYDALLLIKGVDLDEIKTITNCQTVNLETLADLINIKKMFPNSYDTITVPRYSIDTISVKIYDFIYVNGGVNNRIPNYGEYLGNSLPLDIAIPAAAFSYSMQQIKKIRQMPFQKFAQVVTQLEVTNKDLPLINNDEGVPGSRDAANQALALVALGSGNSNTYCMVDFIGAMSGDYYNPIYGNIVNLINQLATPTLATAYLNMWNWTQLTPSDPGYLDNSVLQGYINAANAEIASIVAANAAVAAQLNFWWNQLGSQLTIEQRAIVFAVTVPTLVSEDSNRTDIYDFIRRLETWAVETEYKEIARSIEAIADTDNLTGQSIVGLLREARNANRVALIGGVLDNDVSDSLVTPTASATAIVTNGAITSIAMTNIGSGYNAAQPPQIYVNGVLPPSGIAPVLRPTMTQVGDPINNQTGGLQNVGAAVTNLNIDNPGRNLSDPVDLVVQDPPSPQRGGYPQVAGVLPNLESIFTVPQPLVSSPSSSFTPTEAIDDVTICNCECWIF